MRHGAAAALTREKWRRRSLPSRATTAASAAAAGSMRRCGLGCRRPVGKVAQGSTPTLQAEHDRQLETSDLQPCSTRVHMPTRRLQSVALCMRTAPAPAVQQLHSCASAHSPVHAHQRLAHRVGCLAAHRRGVRHSGVLRHVHLHAHQEARPLLNVPGVGAGWGEARGTAEGEVHGGQGHVARCGGSQSLACCP